MDIKERIVSMTTLAREYDKFIIFWASKCNIDYKTMVYNGFPVYFSEAVRNTRKIEEVTLKDAFITAGKAFFSLDFFIFCAAKLIGEPNYQEILRKKIGMVI